LKVSKLLSLLVFVITNFLVTDKTFSQIEFIENKGQWDAKVKFMSNVGNGAIFIGQRGFTVLQHNQKDLERITDKLHTSSGFHQKESAGANVLNSHAYNVEFLNSNQSAEIIPDKLLPSVNNYL